MAGQAPGKEPKLLCTLVSADDPRHYYQAQFKETLPNGVKYQQTLDAYKHGARFIMSKVGLVEDAKTAYVSCPLEMWLICRRPKWAVAT